MAQLRKSPEEAKELGFDLRRRRRARGLSGKELQVATGVNVGQISRFENGDFKRVSKNLQSVMTFLQIAPDHGESPLRAVELGDRLVQLASRSERHRAAAQAVVLALEQLS